MTISQSIIYASESTVRASMASIGIPVSHKLIRIKSIENYITQSDRAVLLVPSVETERNVATARKSNICYKVCIIKKQNVQ